MRSTIFLVLVIVAAVGSSPRAGAQQTRPTTQPATAPAAASDLEYHEFIVIVADPGQASANEGTLFQTTLPEFIDTRRPRAPATQRSAACPVGIIRMIGSSSAKIDVKIEIAGGRLMSSWPKARGRTNSILWRDLQISSDSTRTQRLDDGSWLNVLRNSPDAAYLTADETPSERFLAYDVELQYPLPLKLGLGGRPRTSDDIDVANTGATPLHDLSLYQPDKHGGWRSGSDPMLAPAKKRPATAPATAQVATTQSATTTPATSAIASSAPTIAPTTEPTTEPSLGVDPADTRQIRLIRTPATQRVELFADWQSRLSQLGLAPAEIQVVLSILTNHAIDDKHLTAVYRLDDGELDRLLPLEVLPQPRKIVRVGLVIVRNADPSVPAEIDDLITQLGDRDWHTREAASKALREIGPIAKSKLQAALKSPDAEIVFRAERLLAALGK